MALPAVYAKKSFKGRLDTKKSNSWWWDSHIGPRNLKWLVENLEDMDQKYKRMLTLIEGDGDSLAKKAEMYYQKRPVLLSHVEEFYRTYKSMAERYEHLTGDMKKNLLPELQTQGSGSDSVYESTSMTTPQDPKKARHEIGHRAAGFEFFLGQSKSVLDRSANREETYSISDSETESDVSSLHSHPGMIVNANEEGMQTRSMELEVESNGEEKFQNQDQEYKLGSFARSSSEIFDDLHSKIAAYEEEIANLKTELQKCKSLDHPSDLSEEFTAEGNSSSLEKVELDFDENIYTMDADESDAGEKNRTLIKELRSTKESLQALDKEVVKLRKEKTESTESIRKMQDLLRIAQKEGISLRGKLETEKRTASKLQERIARYKTSLNEREMEIRELKEVISDANRKYQLHDEISRLTDKNTALEERLREWEVRCHSLETQRENLETKLKDEIDELKADIAEKTGRLETLESDLNALMLKYDRLLTEKDQVDVQMQRVIAENEEKGKREEELTLSLEELRGEVERQRDVISETAEGKREVIRQLCKSLEHYRNGYQQLRQAFTEHKHLPALAV